MSTVNNPRDSLARVHEHASRKKLQHVVVSVEALGRAVDVLNVAEQFLAMRKDGNAEEFLDYFESVISEALGQTTGETP